MRSTRALVACAMLSSSSHTRPRFDAGNRSSMRRRSASSVACVSSGLMRRYIFGQQWFSHPQQHAIQTQPEQDADEVHTKILEFGAAGRFEGLYDLDEQPIANHPHGTFPARSAGVIRNP